MYGIIYKNSIFFAVSEFSVLETTLICVVVLLSSVLLFGALLIYVKFRKKRNIRRISEENEADLPKEPDGYSFINKINSTIASGGEGPEVFTISAINASVPEAEATAATVAPAAKTDNGLNEYMRRLEAKESELDSLIGVLIGLRDGLASLSFGKDSGTGEEISLRLADLERTMAEINSSLKEIKGGAKAGRGRPKKTVTASSQPDIKRGRGRPRKPVDPAAQTAVKRGKGRPRKDAEKK